jgi:hypothetical protein
MKDYQVGQILFLIADASKVVPIQVIEEVIRTTLEGKEKTYIVKLPDKKETCFDIKKIKGEIFFSKKDVKDQMVEHAESIIENVFLTSLSESEELVYLQNTNNQIEEPVVEKMQPEEDDGIIKVDLGNGKFGKISTKELDNAGANK